VVWQPDNITADMTPPAMFQKYCVPFYEKRAKQLKDLNKPYIIHMDGRLKSLKDLIAACPFDVVESFSFAEVGGDLPLPEARSAWPGKVILPNFPSSLCNQSDEKIVSFLNKMLDEVGTGAPFMLQISEDVPLDQWQRVFTILCRFFQELGKIA